MRSTAFCRDCTITQDYDHIDNQILLIRRRLQPSHLATTRGLTFFTPAERPAYPVHLLDTSDPVWFLQHARDR